MGRWPKRYLLFAILSIVISSTSLLFNSASAIARSQRLHKEQNAIAMSKLAILQAPIFAAHALATEQAAAALPPPGLNIIQISLVKNYLRHQCNTPLTPAQLSTLTSELSKPGQRIIDPNIPIPSSGNLANNDTVQDLTLRILPSGEAFITTQHGVNYKLNPTNCSMYINSSGLLLRLDISSPAGIFTLTPAGMSRQPRYIPAPNSTPTYLAYLQSTLQTEILVICTLAIDAALALLLLIAAITLLREPNQGIRLYHIYAWAKFPVEIIACATLIWNNSLSPYSHASLSFRVVWPAVILCLFASVYSILLLLLLHRPDKAIK